MSPVEGTHAPKTQVDWAAVERDYRAGSLSNVQIAATHGCVESAIRWHAKRSGWTKDLSGAVRQATEARLLRADLRQPNAREDAQIVAEASETRASVVLTHRRDIAQLNALRLRLARKLAALVENDALVSLEELSDAQDVLESMARTVARLVPLERQAFGLAANAEPDAARLAPEERRARIAVLQAQLSGKC